jgi:histidinol-phosphate aminotransferase
MPLTEATHPSSINSLLERIRPAVREREPYLVDHPPDIDVKLNQNESPYDLPDDLKDELAERFREVAFNRYPSEQPDRLRRALAGYTGHDEDGILIGNGSNELTYTFGQCLIEPGAPVVLPRPMFSLYEKVVRLEDGEVVGVPPRGEDLTFDAEAICEAVRRRDPVLTVLATPNNPTGRAMSLTEVEAVAEAAEGFVLVDEAYTEFAETKSALALLDEHPNVLVMRTFSKAFGLAGLRLGYVLARPAVVRELMKARLPFMVDRMAEETALALLDRPDLLADRIRRLKESCRELTEALWAMRGVTVVPSQTNFVLFRAGRDPGDLLDRLAEKGVLVRDMSGYPETAGYLRVNAGTPRENKAFLDALEKILHATGP